MNGSTWLDFAKTAVAAGIGVVGLFAVAWWDPAESVWFPQCVLYRSTGLHCAGCGATRAIHELTRGDWKAAIWLNPMLVLGGPVIAGLLVRQHLRRRWGLSSSANLSRGLLLVLLAYSVARNVPTPTRSWLAPATPSAPVPEPDTKPEQDDGKAERLPSGVVVQPRRG